MNKSLLLLFLLIASTAFAQTQRISGKVTSATDGSELPGVNVIVKGTPQGAITDAAGNYTMEITSGTTLVFSFVGYRTQEVPLDARQVVDVSLIEESTELTEVVVTGYSSTERREITGSVATVKASNFKEIALTGIDQALQGQAPGVQVTQSSGTPGGGISVRIRGSTSINASNRPLFVIDGIPVSSGSLSLREFGGQDDNALSLINPNDVESIQILKDASAKAMYGSRGANGVVLITTKKGKKDITRINVDVQRGIVDPVKKVDLLNSTQLLTLQREAYTNAGKNPDAAGLIPGVTDAVNTNWLDAIFRTGIMQQYQLSATGGDDNTTFYMSGNYRSEEGVQLNNKFDRLSGTFNVDRKFTPKLRVGVNLTLSKALNKRVKGDNFLDGVYSGALKSLPYNTPYDENGKLVGPGSALYAGFPNFNPVAQALLPRFNTSTVKILGSITATYKFNEYLQLKVMTGIDYNDVKEDQFESSQTAIGGYLSSVGGKGYGIYSTSTASNFTSNAILSYAREIKEGHHFSALVGSEVLSRFTSSSSVQGRLFPSDDFTYITSAGIVDQGSSVIVKGGLLSFLGEAKYDIRDTYLFSLSFRSDGSSRFGSGNKFAYFPALSAGWRISQEKFFHSDIISDLKLRASYGFTGNQGIPDFEYLGTWTTATYNGSAGVTPENLANPKLQWESTREIDIGTDISFLEGRIQAIIDVYNNKTSKLLYAQPYPYTTGFGSVTGNIGNVQNKGIELGIVSVNLDGKLKWRTEINLSKNVNRITYLADSIPRPAGYQAEGAGTTNIIKAGEPLGTFWGLKFLGVDPATGNAMYKDVNGDNKITQDDAMVIGNAQPNLIGGITNRFTYGNFDLNIFFQFSLGNKVLNLTRQTLVNSGQDLTTNQSVDALRRWQKPGDITDVPRYAVSTGDNANFNNYESSRLIENGSYLRLKNLGLGYNVSQRIAEKLKLDRLRVYLSATNLWTYTKYSGADPEVSTLDGSTTAQGIDFFTLPQVRTITIGLNATLR
ncbi:SusC/RagA family TonB-linked outer membrane protein [Ohtaekwangia sp.]|uniref:SusC/RagA family TonB-linked outer membrane protein n=1 Tax=Ohtaekwangia sp. TaxID=2066019 RepID=UPI002FDF052E